MGRCGCGACLRRVRHLVLPLSEPSSGAGRERGLLAGRRDRRGARGGRGERVLPRHADRRFGFHVDLERARQLVSRVRNGRLLPASPRDVHGRVASQVVRGQRAHDDRDRHGRAEDSVPPDRRAGRAANRFVCPGRGPGRAEHSVRFHQVRLAGRSVPSDGCRRAGAFGRQGRRYADADRPAEKERVHVPGPGVFGRFQRKTERNSCPSYTDISLQAISRKWFSFWCGSSSTWSPIFWCRPFWRLSASR